jgi:hypothetical protein
MRLAWLVLGAAICGGCVTDSTPDVIRYDCSLLRSCGRQTNLTHVDWYADPSDIETMTREWSKACQVLTEPDVVEGRCPSVLCGAICEPYSS